MTQQEKPNNPYARMTNLADARLGAKAIHSTDDFFADMNRMLQNHGFMMTTASGWMAGNLAANASKAMTIALCV